MRARTLGLAALLGLSAIASVAPATAAAPVTSGNLIRDPGAESTSPKPTPDGYKVKVTDWSVSKAGQFTAVRYGTEFFLTAKSAGPTKRGKNFFAGGESGNREHGTQTDSLTAYRKWIATGKATFALSGWLGGYSSQDDYATLTVTWQTAAGQAIASNKIGPVSAAARHDVSSLLHRSTTGTVPKSARQALITLAMVRRDGTYVDGYADNLSLVVTKP